MSKSKEEKINKDDLYKVLIKYQSQIHTLKFDNIIIDEILSNYSPNESSAKALLWKLLCTTSDDKKYTQCIYDIVKVLHDANITYDEFKFEKLQNIIADVLNIDKEKITPETTFVDDLGADSLDVFQIIMGIEDEFDIQIPDDAAESIVTVNDAVVQIQNATK